MRSFGRLKTGASTIPLRDIEIRVAGRQAAAFEDDGLRHRQFDNRQLAAVLVASSLQAAEVRAQGRVVHIFRVRFDHRDDRVFRDEASEVVDVPVGVVAEDAASEPDGVRRAEVIRECSFVVNAAHVRIAFLHLAEQAFFCGENRAGAVDIDGAAFEHDAFFGRERTDFLECAAFDIKDADFFVVTPVGIFRPGVEAELRG